jgi:hypothetical protein
MSEEKIYTVKECQAKILEERRKALEEQQSKIEKDKERYKRANIITPPNEFTPEHVDQLLIMITSCLHDDKYRKGFLLMFGSEPFVREVQLKNARETGTLKTSVYMQGALVERLELMRYQISYYPGGCHISVPDPD